MNSPTRAEYACVVVRARMPDGFCPPFQCQSGIMAKSTMHQTKAMPTHTFSDLCAGFHQPTCGDSRPVCVLMCMLDLRAAGLAEGWRSRTSTSRYREQT